MGVVSLLFLVLSSSVALADEHWCEDLGLHCMTAFSGQRGQTPLLQTLSQRAPEEFLPTDYAAYVRRVQAARARGDQAEVTRLRANENPAAGSFQTLVLVPRNLERGAQLPRSGARMVVDCLGRHAQVRADLPIAQELALLKRVFEQSRAVQLAETLPEIERASYMHVEALTCPMGGTQAPSRSTRSASSWELDAAGSRTFVRFEISTVPGDWVSHTCFERAARGAQPRAAAAMQEQPAQAQGGVQAPNQQPQQQQPALGASSGDAPRPQSDSLVDYQNAQDELETLHDRLNQACSASGKSLPSAECNAAVGQYNRRSRELSESFRPEDIVEHERDLARMTDDQDEQVVHRFRADITGLHIVNFDPTPRPGDNKPRSPGAQNLDDAGHATIDRWQSWCADSANVCRCSRTGISGMLYQWETPEQREAVDTSEAGYSSEIGVDAFREQCLSHSQH